MSGRKLANFELHDLLGEGAMGQVYRAVDLNLDRTVAVKLLSSKIDFDPSFSDRFKREARLAGKLNHPNIATIYAFGEDDGEAFIAMEFVEGKTLQQHIRDQALTYEEIRKYGIQIASALELAHSMEIVHRDIKASNLMITGSGDIKVMDFGVARKGGETQLTMDGALVGTANIMAPEVVKGAEAVPASDLFSVGCVLYEAITGQPAFAGDNAMAVLYNVMHEEPPSLTSARGDIPPDLVEVVNGLLTKDPEARLGPARAIVEILSGTAGSRVALEPPQLQSEAPTMVLPAGAVSDTVQEQDPAGKSWKSNPLIWAGGAVGLVAAVVLAVMLGRPDSRAEAVALTEAGERLLRAGDPAAADSFRAAIRIDPSYAEAYGGLGEHLMRSNQTLSSAEDTLVLAASLRSDYAAPLSNLGRILKSKGELQAAEDTLRQAILRQPQHANSHANLGDVFQETGRHGDAIDSYMEALRWADADTILKITSWNNLSFSLVEEGRFEEATSYVDLALALPLGPRIKSLWKNRGYANLGARNYEQAVVDFERALAIDPAYPEARQGRRTAQDSLSN